MNPEHDDLRSSAEAFVVRTLRRATGCEPEPEKVKKAASEIARALRPVVEAEEKRKVRER